MTITKERETVEMTEEMTTATVVRILVAKATTREMRMKTTIAPKMKTGAKIVMTLKTALTVQILI